MRDSQFPDFWGPMEISDIYFSALLCSQMPLFAIRDGLERIQLSDHATVGDLQKQINANLGIPVEDITLSRDKDLV